MFYETIQKKAKKDFRFLGCVMYTIIDKLFWIDYLACQLKTISEVCVDGKYLVNYFNEFFGIGIPDVLMKLLSCHCFTKNIKYIVVLKSPRRILE